jgi:hypothetical protein
MKVHTMSRPPHPTRQIVPILPYSLFLPGLMVVVPGPMVQVPPPGEVFPPGVIVVPPGPIVHTLPGSPPSAASARGTTVDPPLGST